MYSCRTAQSGKTKRVRLRTPRRPTRARQHARSLQLARDASRPRWGRWSVGSRHCTYHGIHAIVQRNRLKTTDIPGGGATQPCAPKRAPSPCTLADASIVPSFSS